MLGPSTVSGAFAEAFQARADIRLTAVAVALWAVRRERSSVGGWPTFALLAKVGSDAVADCLASDADDSSCRVMKRDGQLRSSVSTE